MLELFPHPLCLTLEDALASSEVMRDDTGYIFEGTQPSREDYIRASHTLAAAQAFCSDVEPWACVQDYSEGTVRMSDVSGYSDEESGYDEALGLAVESFNFRKCA